MSRRVKSVRRGNRPTRRFAESKATGEQIPKNHTADAPRPMRKLKELLCDSGFRTDGDACMDCESRCQFGQEYLLRLKEGEPNE